MRLVATVAIATGCQIDEPAPPVDFGTFPCNPLVHQLDLAILAYQIHGQSMVWPIDPFYEEHDGGLGTPRETFMGLVPDWVARRAPAQIVAMPALDAYRGPGALAGLADNPTVVPADLAARPGSRRGRPRHADRDAEARRRARRLLPRPRRVFR